MERGSLDDRSNRPCHSGRWWELDALIDQWTREVRNQFGDITGYIGHVHDDPEEIVIIVLLPDEGAFHTYLHHMAGNPWAQRFMQLVEGEADWEEIEVNQVWA